ncbi:MAG: MFS transporter [Promethearchaeota archaeon]
MDRSITSPRSFIFDLYLRPSLLILVLYQIIVTVTFTAQQMLLAAYLDELGFIVISGVIIAAYFLFWFVFGPIFGTLSDLHGRKFLLVLANCVSFVGFFGLVLAPDPLLLFIMNALLGFGAAIRVGSVIALWVQHSPQDRIGESLGYNSILLTIGGVGGALIGVFMWTTIQAHSFIILGILLLVSAIPIIFISDSGNYIPFSFETLLNVVREKSNQKVFISIPIIQVSIHWLAFSTIVSFSTFIIPIIERLSEEFPTGIELQIPFQLSLFISLALIISCVGGLIIWGRISDLWARKPVLIIGYAGTLLLVFLGMTFFLFDWLPLLIDGLNSNDSLSIMIIGFLLPIIVFTAISLVTTPTAWISDIVGQDDLAKAMSLRQVLIGMGTVMGVLVGGYVIGTYGISGLLLIILILLVVSAVILL